MIDWNAIDTVLLDMDGTLLDLNFDNRFWLRHVPACFAEANGIGFDDACKMILAQMSSIRGTLDWYCTDYWSGELGLDIIALKADLAHLIRPRPGASEFLRWLQQTGKRTWLATNAHEDTIALKMDKVDFSPWLDEMVSSHQFGAPKENAEFWDRLFDTSKLTPGRCLFIDDNTEVLRTASRTGIRYLLDIRQPDLSAPARETSEFPAIGHFNEIMDC